MSATMPHGSPPTASCSSAVSAPSFATKPSVGMMPTIDATAMNENTAITGAWRPTPLSSRMSRVDSWRSTTPTTRNSADLNSAWLSSSARPASAASRVP